MSSFEVDECVPDRISKDPASRALRTLPPQNAFFFYRTVGAPTGAAARNLPDFLRILNAIDLSSIQFHLGRGDFENWIRMLGDDTLAKQLADLRENKLRGEDLRVQLVGAVKARIDRLQ